MDDIDLGKASYAMEGAYRSTHNRRDAVRMAKDQFHASDDLYDIMWRAIDAYVDMSASEPAPKPTGDADNG